MTNSRAKHCLLLAAVFLSWLGDLSAQRFGFERNAGQWPDHVEHATSTDDVVIWLEAGTVCLRERTQGDVTRIELTDGAASGVWTAVSAPTRITRLIDRRYDDPLVTDATTSLVWMGDTGETLEVSLGGTMTVRASRPLTIGSRLDGSALARGDALALGDVRLRLGAGESVVRAGPDVWTVGDLGEVVLLANLLGTGALARSVEARPDGRVVVAGEVVELDFPTTPGALQTAPSSDQRHAFVAELAADGSSFTWATYLGSEWWTYASALALTDDGSVVVAGSTALDGFPTTPGTFKEVNESLGDVFVSILSPDGSTLVASSYLGSDLFNGEVCWALTLTAGGDIGLAVQAGTLGYPFSENAYVSGDTQVGVVTVLSSDLSSLVVSAAIGGSLQDIIYDLVFDEQNRPIVVGLSQSLDFPLTENGWSHDLPPGASRVGAFAARFSADATTLEVSTMVGVPGKDDARAVALLPTGEVKVAGVTSLASSTPFPVSPNAIKAVQDQIATDFFVSTFSPDLDTLLHSTLIGGGGYESTSLDLIADSTGLTYLVGTTSSNTFPTTQGAYLEEPKLPLFGGDSDGVLVVLHPTGAPMLYSSHLPMIVTLGAGNVTDDGDVLVAGRAPTPFEFPADPDSTTGTQLPGGDPGAVMRIRPLPFGVTRFGEPDATPDGLLVNGVLSQPYIGAREFGFTCQHAPPWARGWLLVSAVALDVPLDVGGASLLVDPDALLLAAPISANGRGWAESVLPVPDAPELSGTVAHAQWLWPDVGGGWLTSGALRLEVP